MSEYTGGCAARRGAARRSDEMRFTMLVASIVATLRRAFCDNVRRLLSTAAVTITAHILSNSHHTNVDLSMLDNVKLPDPGQLITLL